MDNLCFYPQGVGNYPHAYFWQYYYYCYYYYALSVDLNHSSHNIILLGKVNKMFLPYYKPNVILITWKIYYTFLDEVY